MKKEFLRMRLDELIPYENNPRNNAEAVDATIASIQQCGNLDPIEIDENNVILSGHTRRLALLKMGYEESDVVRYTGLTEEQKKKYRLLANKTNEFAGWDFEKLEVELDGLDFEGFDFRFDFVTDSDGSHATTDVHDDGYDKEPPEKPKSKTGQLYRLGEHLVLCGDSTKAEDWSKLMNNEKAKMVFTDPPYNVDIGNKNAYLNSFQKAGSNLDTLVGDSGMTDADVGEKLWKPAFKNLYDFASDDCCIYVTMPQGGAHMMMMMMMSAFWQVKHELIWVKNAPTFSMGRLDYDYKHEPICYGWKKSHNFYGGGEQNKSVWEFDKPRASKLHPTMKPVELIANAILNSSKKGDIITDAFGGSGSTLIACEQTGRRCRMIELEPKYIDVIIDRWEQATGQKAELIK